MKKILYSLLLIASASISYAQTSFKDVKVGHIYNISIPSNMYKTVELIDGASFQFMDTIQNAYGYVIEESKEDIKLSGSTILNAKGYFDFIMEDFLIDLKKRKIGLAKTQILNGNTYIQNECSYFDEEDQASYYYYVTIVETGTHYYCLICYTSEDSKDKLKDQFYKIGLTIKEM